MNNMYLTFCLAKKKHHCVETCRPVTGALTLKECERKYHSDYHYCAA